MSRVSVTFIINGTRFVGESMLVQGLGRAARGAEGRGCERMGVCGVQEGDDEEKILVAANFRVAECHPKTEFWL